MDRLAVQREELLFQNPKHAGFWETCMAAQGLKGNRGTEVTKTWVGTVGVSEKETHSSTVKGWSCSKGDTDMWVWGQRKKGVPGSRVQRHGATSVFFSSIQCVFIKHILCSCCGLNKKGKAKIPVIMEFIFSWGTKTIMLNIANNSIIY